MFVVLFADPMKSNTLLRRKIFLNNLDHIYSQRTYLLSTLEEMKILATNQTLKLVIAECSSDNIGQLKYIENMYKIIKEDPTLKRIVGFKAIALEAYLDARNIKAQPLEKDCSILLYLQIIESLQVLYLKALQGLAKRLDYDSMNLRYPYDLAVANQLLLYDIHLEMVA